MTVHDGTFFSSHVRQNRLRAPNERAYKLLKLQKEGEAPSSMKRSTTLDSIDPPCFWKKERGSVARAFADKPIEDGPAQHVRWELLVSVACAFDGIGVAQTLSIIAEMFVCLNITDPVIAIFMLLYGQQMFCVRGFQYEVKVVLATALSLSIKTVMEERFYVGDLLRACEFLNHIDTEEMVAAEKDLFSCVSLEGIRERFITFRAMSALNASEAVECRSSRFDIELRVFFNPGIGAAFQQFAICVFECAVRTVRIVYRVSDAHILISDSISYKEFALNPEWQFLRAPPLIVLVEQVVTNIPGCVSFANLPSANALLVCVAHCM